MSEEVEAHIYKKFEILQKLGKGAYGIVWKAIEKKTKKMVALKKVFEAFHNETDAQRTFREVMILQELNNHENIIKLLNVIRAENNKDLYLVFEFMETDLHAVIKARILKKVHKPFIIYQLLKGLKYMHSGEIIHRDLKPSNLLINSQCLIKIADFGLARSIAQFDEDYDPIFTEYVATRWYRAPEIVLGSNKYSKSVDLWSVGCILAEMINEKALFPGKSTLNQIELIIDVIGKPSNEDIKSINSQNASSIISSITVKNRKQFESFFNETNPVALDFLRRCFEFNPEKRFTIEEALAHPYVAEFRDEKEELIIDRPVQIPINDNTKLTIKEYREALYNDIIVKKKEQRKVWRQKYLQQLGIDLKTDAEKKMLFKNFIAKKKDPARPDELPTEPEKIKQSSILQSKASNSSIQPPSSLLYGRPSSQGVKEAYARPASGPVAMSTLSNGTKARLDSSGGYLDTGKNDSVTLVQMISAKASSMIKPEKGSFQNKSESLSYVQKKLVGSSKDLGSFGVSQHTSHISSQKTRPQVVNERKSTGIFGRSPQPASVNSLGPKQTSFKKIENYYRDILSKPIKK